MKILIVGSDQIWALENHYLKHLKVLNPDTRLFPAPSISHAYLSKSYLNKFLHRFHLSNIFEKINEELKWVIEEFKPDVIWVFKGMDIFPQTLVWAKSRGIKLVNYNPDSPFVFKSRGNGNKNITHSFPLFDVHFSYSRRILARINSEFAIPSFLLPFAYELEEAILHQSTLWPENNKVCFVGNPDQERIVFLRKLLRSGLEIDIYGNSWDRAIVEKGVQTFPAIYGNNFWRIIRTYRVQLNMLREHNEDSHNMRSFEIPAIGGIQLASDTSEHRDFFEEGREIFLYRSIDECLHQIKMLKALSVSEAEQIRNAARQRCTRSGYSYQDRASYVLSVLKNM